MKKQLEKRVSINSIQYISKSGENAALCQN